MNLLRRFRPTNQRPVAFSLVDIGRDTVKAVVALVIPGTPQPQVIGYGLAETGGRDVTGGRLEAAAVTGPINTALTRAEDSTEAVIGQKVVPDEVILALPGRAAVGQLFTVRQNRPNPARPVTPKELKQVTGRVERLAHQKLAQLPVEGGSWQPLAVTGAGIRLDERLTLDAVGLTGRELVVSVFGVAAQTGALRALELLAGRLDLTLVNVVSAWQALAAVAPQTEAVVLEMGAAGTDACLIRDDALVAAGWTPFGGDFFTQALAEVIEVDLAAAKELKHAWTAGELSQREADWLDTRLEPARQRWYEAVLALLTGLAGRKPLPWKIYLTGGGSLLPGLERWLRVDPAPFSHAPEVNRLEPHLSTLVKDLTQGLDYTLFALALSLTAGLPE